MQAMMRSEVLPVVLLSDQWAQYYLVVRKGSQEFAFLLKAQNMGQVALVVDYIREVLQLPERFFPGALSQQVSCCCNCCTLLHLYCGRSRPVPSPRRYSADVNPHLVPACLLLMSGRPQVKVFLGRGKPLDPVSLLHTGSADILEIIKQASDQVGCRSTGNLARSVTHTAAVWPVPS
jgi:hypothetical protein